PGRSARKILLPNRSARPCATTRSPRTSVSRWPFFAPSTYASPTLPCALNAWAVDGTSAAMARATAMRTRAGYSAQRTARPRGAAAIGAVHRGRELLARGVRPDDLVAEPARPPPAVARQQHAHAVRQRVQRRGQRRGSRDAARRIEQHHVRALHRGNLGRALGHRRG